jgi:hypothetical protein
MSSSNYIDVGFGDDYDVEKMILHNIINNDQQHGLA